MQIKSYEGAVKYLESFIGKVVFKVDPKSIKLHPPLDRMKMLLSLLGNPQNKFKSVLVGGTSGKGSTAYLISHILTTSGYKTGLTISPHLQKINERVQINNQSISDEEFTILTASMIRIIETMEKMPIGAPSYFEILIAMAFLYFAQEKVDLAVVEVGMGGEYDATNTLYPLIAVLTNVSLDHTSVLGKTVQKIARTKVGIIKSIKYKALSSKYQNKLIVISGAKQKSVIKIVENKCKEVEAELYRLGKDFNFRIKKESKEGSVFDFYSCHSERSEESRSFILLCRTQDDNITLSLIGNYQVENASIAIKTVLELQKFGFKISEEQIKEALKTAFFPGRFEIIFLPCRPEFISGSSYSKGEMPKQVRHDKKKTIILDGAHNPTKMKAFISTLTRLFPKEKKIFVIGFKRDKDIRGMLKEITRVADCIVATEFRAKTDISNNASAEAVNLKSQISNLKYSKEIYVEKDSKSALDKGLKFLTIEQHNNSAIVVVTGSLYLVGEIRNML